MSRYHDAASTNLYYKIASHRDTDTHTSSYNFYTEFSASNYLVAFIGTIVDNKMDESKKEKNGGESILILERHCISYLLL